MFPLPPPKRSVNLAELVRQIQMHDGRKGPFRLKLAALVEGSASDRKELHNVLTRSSSVVSVDVRVIHSNLPQPHPHEQDDAVVSNQALYQILQDLGRLPRLTCLKLSGYCHAMPISVLSHLLRTASRLTTFSLTSVKLSGSRQELHHLSKVVAAHQSLNDCRLQDCQFVSHGHSTLFLDSLLSGIAACSSMESLLLVPTRPNALGVLSLQAIPWLVKLKSLRLGLIGNFLEKHNGDNASPLQVLLSLLATNDHHETNLRYLQIPFHPDRTNCLALQSTLLQNTTLRGLCLRTPTDHSNGGSSLTLIADALRVNSTLQSFELTGALRIRDPVLLQEFAQIVQVNYTLQDLVLFELVTSPQHSTPLKYHAKLNQHGRKQWLDEMHRRYEPNAPSASSGHCNNHPIWRLEQLAQDPDDLYYYLSQMNPSFLEHVRQSQP